MTESQMQFTLRIFPSFASGDKNRFHRSKFRKLFKFCEKIDILTVFVRTAPFTERLCEGLVYSPLLQHVHEEVIEVTIQNVPCYGVAGVRMIISFKHRHLVNSKDIIHFLLPLRWLTGLLFLWLSVTACEGKGLTARLDDVHLKSRPGQHLGCLLGAVIGLSRVHSVVDIKRDHHLLAHELFGEAHLGTVGGDLPTVKFGGRPRVLFLRGYFLGEELNELCIPLSGHAPGVAGSVKRQDGPGG